MDMVTLVGFEINWRVLHHKEAIHAWFFLYFSPFIGAILLTAAFQHPSGLGKSAA
jgi:hypothetical protein